MNRWNGFKTLVWREIVRFFTVALQTLLPPLVSGFLYIFIFGLSLGTRLGDLQGVPYLKFMLPGMIMMYVIESAYQNTSSSLFISRWANYIEELLVTPLSYTEMVFAVILGGLARSMLIAAGVFGVASIFVQLPWAHPFAVFYFLILVSLTFSCLGMIVALVAEEFEHITIATTFLITPLVFFGGVFHSITMLPKALQTVTAYNPIFYMINGLRYSFLGAADVPVERCMIVVGALFLALFFFTIYLFRSGYKLRK
jgi:ABC-2 type transport system permease protein